ncbi:non-specific serine/threonine protein kinase [Saccharopolyspora erythraea NRRL 2338]|uniref:ATP-binding protein n=1 Tax=Saccharopolyspora erythraea TaxID=1836 RepID=UPI000C012DA8|nr:LuxR C-terminal-related transcriptional regulator [Saccharopolyspora erythraea]PFG93090.1 non-specific serine/threonine protein kinase [Saccharopolyspora erythraea NRRL 2338]
MTTKRVGRLPDDLTSFVGRRGASAQVKKLLATSRLVTLTGVGGVGKSRLAVHVARGLRRAFPDGVWLVELARVTEPGLLDRAVVADLNLGDPPAGLDALVARLTGRRMLIVLDGCEHLLDECGPLVGAILSGAPEVRLLVTSRSPLGVAGERVWPVPPMTVPARGSRESDAVVLFEDRASAVLPGFTVGPENQAAVATLCVQLDGLPLAIELAAVWMRSLSVDEILTRVTDHFQLLNGGDRSAVPHHRSLRATIAWSFDLCTPVERTLWSRLSVFAGGFELESAEEVCSGDGLSADDLLCGIAGLVERSVLSREDTGDSRSRYRLLKTIREYGRQRLGHQQEVVLRRRHRDHYLLMAEYADAEWLGPGQTEWLVRLQRERENLWAALEFCLSEPGEASEGLRMAAALRFFWLAGGALRDGREWLDEALAVTTEPTPVRGKALAVNGLISAMLGDVDEGLELLAEARGLEDPSVPHLVGVVELLRNDHAAADAAFQEALRFPDLLRHDGLAVMTLPNRALASVFLGDPAQAIAHCEECLEICDEHGEQWARSWAEIVLGLAHWRQGDAQEGAAHLREALRLKSRFNDITGVVVCLEMLAWTEAARGRPDLAVRLFAAVVALWQPLGTYLFGIRCYLDWHTAALARARGMLRVAELRSAEREGSSFTLAEAVADALGEREVVSPADVPAQLTRREREVADLVARGLSNRQIAQQLVIAKRTSDSHIEHILTKLGFSSRAQIAAWVAEQAGKP